MNDRLEELETAREKIDDRFGHDAMERGLVSLHARIGREKRRASVGRQLALAASVALALGGGAMYGRYSARKETLAQTNPANAVVVADAGGRTDDVVRFPDGTTAVAIAAGTSIQIQEVSATRVTSNLETGAARFEVVPNHDRAFEVKVGGVKVTVLGTIFEVHRRDTSVHVAVARGRVRIDSPLGSWTLNAGERGDFAIPTEAPKDALLEVPIVHPEQDDSPRAAIGSTAAPKGAHSWRALAKSGNVKGAYEIVRTIAPSQIRDAEELLSAADVARLSGHASDGVPYLERVLREFGHDSRAPLAAFSLGRILSSTDARGAASRFEQAYRLAPASPLAEDALARAAEAWSRAGSSADANRVASEYAARYPRGAHAEEMRTLIGP